MQSLFVCLGVFVPLENFLLTKTSSSLVKAYARHSWTLSSEGSLTCHTCCYTEHPFIMVIFEDPLAERLAVALSLPFLRLRSVAAGIRTPNALNHCTNAAVALLCKWNQSHQEEWPTLPLITKVQDNLPRRVYINFNKFLWSIEWIPFFLKFRITNISA